MYVPASSRSQATGQIWRLKRAGVHEPPVAEAFAGVLAKTFISEYIFYVLY
jgi:hypothetical protein